MEEKKSLYWFVVITDLGRSVWFSDEEKAICWLLWVGGWGRIITLYSMWYFIPSQKLLKAWTQFILRQYPYIQGIQNSGVYIVGSRSPKDLVAEDALTFTSPDFQVSILSIDYLLNSVKLLPLLALWSWLSHLVSMSLRFLICKIEIMKKNVIESLRKLNNLRCMRIVSVHSRCSKYVSSLGTVGLILVILL